MGSRSLVSPMCCYGCLCVYVYVYACVVIYLPDHFSVIHAWIFYPKRMGTLITSVFGHAKCIVGIMQLYASIKHTH